MGRERATRTAAPVTDDEITALLPLHPRDFLILLSLTDGELHGYGLVKAIEEESGGEVRMDPANLYRSLRRLERDGWVRESVCGDEDGDDRRRCYGLTEFGRRVVAGEAARVSRLVRVARSKKLIPTSETSR